jgi:xanthine dehydrogenase YagS FAD-binding subunit
VATALVALGARLEIGGAAGAAREAALEDFFVRPEEDPRRENRLQPGDLLTAVLVPPRPATVRSAHLKQGEKASFDWAVAEAAVAIERDAAGRCAGASVVLGAVAPVPWRARRAEAVLVGQPIAEASARAAARAALEEARPLSQNGYKVPVLEAVVARAILAAAS